ncbi:hypothetical protein QRD43_21175 [Pelomonas sp. APW6]|uniref:RNA polymerase sigma-70 region 4 domain-containing protein n=1 Tax=Roseateles subflavus TaxID=3053353 RepID=A0ABT7LNH8_9BURK|nr:hypothetical protein [Pelomonas sp. APW6]MDL5034429.1 hypothetical protein [Pelomonas sp. APW6]
MTMTPEERDQRRALVLKLKRGGKSFAEIGAAIGVSASRAQQLYRGAFRLEQACIVGSLPPGLSLPLSRRGLHTAAQILAAWNAGTIRMGDGIAEGKMRALDSWALKQPGAARGESPQHALRLTSKQIAKAARLYSLALAAHVGGAEDDEAQAAVKQAARDAAHEALGRLGFEAGQLVTVGDCINAVCNS